MPWKFRGYICSSSGVIVLTNKQTDRQSHKQTLLKTIAPSLHYAAWVVTINFPLPVIFCCRQCQITHNASDACAPNQSILSSSLQLIKVIWTYQCAWLLIWSTLLMHWSLVNDLCKQLIIHLFLDPERVPKSYKCCSYSCYRYHIFENSLKLCQYATDRIRLRTDICDHIPHQATVSDV